MLVNRDLLVERMAENLPVLRKKLKLSQEGLANIVGSSRYTIMLYETKKRKIPWNVFLTLVLLFDKNGETSPLQKALNIYTEELERFILYDSESEMQNKV